MKKHPHRRTLLKASCAALILAAPLLSGPARAQTQWDMPTAYPVTNFHTLNAQKFADAVKKSTGGKVEITVHGGASLYKAPEIKRAIQTGQAQIGEVLMVNLANEDASFGVDGVPFLATTYAAARKLAAAARPVIAKKLEAQGLELLYTVAWPAQGIYTNKPLEGLKDLEGLKWRAYSPQTQRIGELIKAQPVSVQAAELTQALATGKVNAMMTSGATGVDSKVWEQLGYFYDVQAWLPKNMVIVNKAAFEKLDPETRKIIRDEAAKAEDAGWAASEQVTRDSLAALARNGMKVVTPSETFRKELAAIGATLIDEWRRSAGTDGEAILQAYQK
jgi:TRAP-type transport system periplasmic protein